MTASEVQSALGGQLAYTTVMTTLARLYRKGAIERVAEGRAFRYSLVDSPERAKSNITAHQMIKLLDGESDRAGALSRFVSELGAEDEQLLSELLRRPPDGDGLSDRSKP
jgi:predicted transcriptional regulator